MTLRFVVDIDIYAPLRNPEIGETTLNDSSLQSVMVSTIRDDSDQLRHYIREGDFVRVKDFEFVGIPEKRSWVQVA